MARFRPLALLLKLLAVSAGTLVLVETGLRAVGREPFNPPAGESFQGQPRNRFRPDPVLGWIKAPGSYPRERNDEEPKRTIQEHFLPGDLRAASPAQQQGKVGDGRPQLLFLGCSFTEGGGLSDEETFAWKVQEMFPQIEVLNMGTSAWSTAQSALALETIALSAPEMRNIAGVIYDFVDFHNVRNIGLPAWHRALAWINPEGTIALPSCELAPDAGPVAQYATGAASLGPSSLRCFAPEPYPRFPFRQSLAFSALSEEIWLSLKHRGRGPQRDVVTELLIARMKAVLDAKGIPFRVVMLAKVNGDSDPEFMEKLEAREIDVVSCMHGSQPPGGGSVSLNYVLHSNGHPNELLNTHWAECMEAEVEKMFELR